MSGYKEGPKADTRLDVEGLPLEHVIVFPGFVRPDECAEASAWIAIILAQSANLVWDTLEAFALAALGVDDDLGRHPFGAYPSNIPGSGGSRHAGCTVECEDS